MGGYEVTEEQMSMISNLSDKKLCFQIQIVKLAEVGSFAKDPSVKDLLNTLLNEASKRGL